MSDPLRLYTFAISHFSEKIRWTLDAARIPYEEVVWTPSLHLVRARLKSGKGTTVPIIETHDAVVQDSTDILHWLSKHRAPFPLLPADDAERAAVFSVEERFDRVGSNVIRFAYGTALEEPKAVQAMWLVRANRLERALVPLLFPAIEPTFRRMFKVYPDAVARSRRVIGEELDWLDREVSSGRRYLVGSKLTVADITAAALLAPLACPDEHPVYGTESYRKVIRPAVHEWSNRPAFEWVRALYRTERRA